MSERDQTALIVIDMQMDVVANAHLRAEVIATIAGLVEQARAAGLPVVWVQHHDDYLQRGSPDWQLVPELQPQAGEPVIHKAYPDAFAETELAAELERLGVRQLVLCGAQSDVCITSTLTGGLYRGYSVTLVEDAHTTEPGDFGGRAYPPAETIAWINRQAAGTRLPGVSARLVTHDRAFAEPVGQG